MISYNKIKNNKYSIFYSHKKAINFFSLGKRIFFGYCNKHKEIPFKIQLKIKNWCHNEI